MRVHPVNDAPVRAERDFFIDNLMIRIHFIIEMIRWTGLACTTALFVQFW